MILKKLKLENIRSYEDVEVDFQLDTTLLSGDIGSGKSTILLAIEFCLFGIQRGELSGNGILRHGAKSGSISLTFEINKKEIQIKRILKRTSTELVAQDPGFIIIEDTPKQLSPTEIKQKVIELLGYPQENLTKKSPVFRYTVYTPQENMKTILTSDKESRIDTIRKAFDIDKYKTIRNNSRILLQEIKNKKREFASQIYDLEDKKELLKQKQNKSVELEIEKNKIDISIIRQKLDKEKYELLELEEKIKQFNELKKQIIIKNEKINQIIEIKKRNSIQEDNLKEKIFKKQPQGQEYNKTFVQQERIKYEDTVNVFQEKRDEIQNQIITLRANKEQSNQVKESIIALTKCPTCLQAVSDIHKKIILEKEGDNLNKINQELEKLLHQDRDIASVLESAKNKLIQIQTDENKIKILELMQKEVDELKQELSELQKEQDRARTELIIITQEKSTIEENLKKIETVEYEYNLKKEKLDQIREEERKISIEYASKEREISLLKEEIQLINFEVKKKEQIKQKLERYSQLQEWIETTFIEMMLNIEKSLMQRIKQEFNQLVQKWFSMLIEDENILISIDEEFTPIIEQNGYNTEYDFLSGGERTAVALAYRLALNQTINNIISKINTKDLIILDEPTEGFSSEQLDKLRGVLEELKVEQIIIVSHEAKIESFVDNIIRIKKENNKSEVIYN